MQRNVVHYLFSLTDLQNVHTNKVWSKQSFHQVKVKKNTVRIRKSHWLIILTDIWNMLTCFVIYSQTVLILQTWCWSIANVVTLIFCIFRYPKESRLLNAVLHISYLCCISIRLYCAGFGINIKSIVHKRNKRFYKQLKKIAAIRWRCRSTCLYHHLVLLRSSSTFV